MAANAGKSAPFVITRTFVAPRDLMFRVWTEAEHLARSFGPKSCGSGSAQVDLRPGGIFHYAMKMADGSTMWGKWTFRVLVRPKKLVFVVSFSDEAGGITSHPYSPDWSREMLSTFTFAERDGKSTVNVEWSPLNAGEAEIDTFEAGRPGMNTGWTGTFDQLEAHLARVGKTS